MKTKRILVLILTFVIVCSCVSVASFAAFGGGGRESGGFVGGGRFESVSPDSLWSNVGASGLQSLCVDVNVNSDYFTFWEALGLSEHGVAGIENFSVYGESGADGMTALGGSFALTIRCVSWRFALRLRQNGVRVARASVAELSIML